MPHQPAETIKKIDAKPHKISLRKTGKQTPSPSAKNKANEEERFQMIADAAYYRALGRGFDGVDTVDDWLMAEEEIDSMLPDWEDPDRQSSCD